jgi:hypothetical protein
MYPATPTGTQSVPYGAQGTPYGTMQQPYGSVPQSYGAVQVGMLIKIRKFDIAPTSAAMRAVK